MGGILDPTYLTTQTGLREPHGDCYTFPCSTYSRTVHLDGADGCCIIALRRRQGIRDSFFFYGRVGLVFLQWTAWLFCGGTLILAIGVERGSSNSRWRAWSKQATKQASAYIPDNPAVCCWPLTVAAAWTQEAVLDSRMSRMTRDIMMNKI